MAEKQLVVFELGTEEYGINITQVREIIRYVNTTKVPHALDYVEGIINIRGEIIPVISLAKRFGTQDKSEMDKRIVIVDLPQQDIGIVVDKVTEVLRLDDKQTPTIAVNERIEFANR